VTCYVVVNVNPQMKLSDGDNVYESFLPRLRE